MVTQPVLSAESVAFAGPVWVTPLGNVPVLHRALVAYLETRRVVDGVPKTSAEGRLLFDLGQAVDAAKSAQVGMTAVPIRAARGEVLNVKQTARVVGLSERGVRAAAVRLGGWRDGGRWRFDRDELERRAA